LYVKELIVVKKINAVEKENKKTTKIITEILTDFTQTGLTNICWDTGTDAGQ